MTITVSPCVPDEGLVALIPDDALRMTTFVEAYHRFPDNAELLKTGFLLEDWQYHAALAYYYANKELFDAEYERVKERQRKFWEEAAAKNGDRNVWAEIAGRRNR